jgi:hypothetical protein
MPIAPPIIVELPIVISLIDKQKSGRGADAEVAGVVGLELHDHALSGAGAELVVDDLVAPDAALDRRAGLPFRELNTLAADVAGLGRRAGRKAEEAQAQQQDEGLAHLRFSSGSWVRISVPSTVAAAGPRNSSSTAPPRGKPEEDKAERGQSKV